MGPSVVEIIDHHADAGHYRDTCTHRLIELVGSTATLVADLYREASQPLPPALAQLLAITIRVDTVDFRQEANRTTPKDQVAFDALIPSSQRQVADALWLDLKAAKANAPEKTMGDLLREGTKDYLAAPNLKFGIVSVGKEPSELFLDKDALFQELHSIVKDNAYAAFYVMFYSGDDVFTRWLMLFSPDSALNESVFNHLVPEHLETEMTRIEHSSGCLFLAKQTDGSMSRKRLSPVIEAVMSDLG
jgi:inorganic pyrophosphatase/exopolyphosphatase